MGVGRAPTPGTAWYAERDVDLPLSVAQLVKSYDISTLRWDSADDRYVVVR